MVFVDGLSSLTMAYSNIYYSLAFKILFTHIMHTIWNRGFCFLELTANSCQYPSIPFIYYDFPKPKFISSLSFCVFNYNHHPRIRQRATPQQFPYFSQKKSLFEVFLYLNRFKGMISYRICFSSQMGQEKK